MKLNEKYLIVKGSGGGGLGDRLRCVLTAIAYAKLTDRCLYVDWSDGKLVADNRNVFFDLFALQDVKFTQTLPQSDDVYPATWRGRLGESLHTLYNELNSLKWDRKAAIDNFSFDQKFLDYPEQILVMWEFDQLTKLLDYYPQNTEQALMRDLADRHLSFEQKIVQSASQFQQKHFAANKTLIAVHIRATDEFKAQKDNVLLDQYKVQIKAFLNADPDNCKLFLATDNSDIEKQLEIEYPQHIVTRDKWFAKAGDKLHFNDNCPDQFQALIDATVELYLLASTDYLIYQHNSSFGMSAHILSHAVEENIAALIPGQHTLDRVKKTVKSLLRFS